MTFHFDFQIGDRVFWLNNSGSIYFGNVVGRLLSYCEGEEEGDEKTSIHYSCSHSSGIYTLEEKTLFGDIAALYDAIEEQEKNASS